jgi:hypothetical protein
MNNSKARTAARRENLSELLVQWRLTPEDAYAIMRQARSLQWLYEVDCNEGLTPRQERRMERLQAQATALATRYGLYAYHQTDPRGWPILLDRNPIDEAHTYEPFRVCPYAP